MPLGADREVSVDFRLIAATNRVWTRWRRPSRFREDLLFRVRAIGNSSAPPLRHRKEDIEEIALAKIHQLADHYGEGAKGISREFLDALAAHDWPGNASW
ncbi:MAG: sigma 54-interacting transcriptional regulator [Desulfobacterales bacterium]